MESHRTIRMISLYFVNLYTHDLASCEKGKTREQTYLSYSEALLYPTHSTAASFIIYPPTYLAVSGTDVKGSLDARSSHLERTVSPS